VEFALSLGVTDVLTFEGRRPANSSDDECLTRLLPRVIELFQQAISHAAPKGVRFLIEPHPFTVGMHPEFLIRLCDALPPEHFGVTCDFCHFGVGRPKDYIKVIRRLGRKIQHLHYSDSDQISSELHFVPSEGRLDMQGILQALKDSGYRGKLTLDLYGYPTPVAGAKRAVPGIPQACEFLGIEVR
jgi:sugar phosphate isomerase/epimerase